MPHLLGHEASVLNGRLQGPVTLSPIAESLVVEPSLPVFKEIMHFHSVTYMATPEHKNPCPRGHEIYNCGRAFLGHHYYILGLSDLCLGVEKIFKEIMHFWELNEVQSPYVVGLNKRNDFCEN